MTVDAVVDGLWGPVAPVTARNTVQVYVSHLRRVLGRDAVRWETGGYRLSVEADSIDVHRFVRLAGAGHDALAAGTAERARDLLTEALDLWRGTALGGCGDAVFVPVESSRLEEVRLLAVEDRCAADLGLAPGEDLVAELRALVARHPFRERLWAMLVRALYRGGRRAEALAAYAQARTVLVDELGIEPGPELSAVHTAVLSDDVALAPPPAPASPLLTRPPVPLTSLVGRALEVGEIAALLADDRVRLLTLLGPGGVGKTRLALAAAAQIEAKFADGVCWVPLAALREARHVPAALAVALGLGDERVEDDAVARSASVLRRREILVLIDNVEHLLPDAARLIARIVGAVPRLKVLATSRVALRVAGEHRYRVPTLPAQTAGALFVQRARAVDPAFVPDDRDDRVVAELCTRLDGLPLAIELAASRANLFSPTDLLGRLADALSLSGAPSLDTADRHRSLRVALDWSHDLLGAPARELFAQLSVFRGGFTVEAAAAVAGCGHDAVTDLLDELLEASLVTPTVASGDGHGHHRFFMLETVRTYASERLTDPAPVRDRHARFVRSLVTGLWACQPPVWSPRTLVHATALETEQENVRAAVAHTAATGQHTVLAELVTHVAGYWSYWSECGMVTELGGWLAAVLDAPVPALLRWDATFWAAELAVRRGDLAEARVLAGALTVPGADQVRESRGWLQSAWRHMLEGDTVTAISQAQTALALVSGTGNPLAIGAARGFLGVFLQETAPDRGRAMLREAIRLFRSSGNEMGLAQATNNLAANLLLGGDATGAVAAAREALDQPITKRATGFRAQVQDTLGAALLFAGDLTGAHLSLVAALRGAQWCADTGLVVVLTGHFAALAAARGDLRRAVALQSAHDTASRHLGIDWSDHRYLEEHFLDALPERLGHTTAAAVALGAAMTVDSLPEVLLDPAWPPG